MLSTSQAALHEQRQQLKLKAVKEQEAALVEQKVALDESACQRLTELKESLKAEREKVVVVMLRLWCLCAYAVDIVVVVRMYLGFCVRADSYLTMIVWYPLLPSVLALSDCIMHPRCGYLASPATK